MVAAEVPATTGTEAAALCHALHLGLFVRNEVKLESWELFSKTLARELLRTKLRNNCARRFDRAGSCHRPRAVSDGTRFNDVRREVVVAYFSKPISLN